MLVHTGGGVRYYANVDGSIDAHFVNVFSNDITQHVMNNAKILAEYVFELPILSRNWQRTRASRLPMFNLVIVEY